MVLKHKNSYYKGEQQRVMECDNRRSYFTSNGVFN